MIKVISGSENNWDVTFDFYMELPTGNNNAGITWLETIGLSKLYDVENISGTNYIKTRETYTFSSAELTNPQRLSELETHNTELQTEILDKLQTELKFTGYVIEDE